MFRIISQQKEIGFGNQLLKSYASKSSNTISNGFGSFDLHYWLASLCFILGHSYITFFISRAFQSKLKIVKQLKLGYVTLRIHHHKLNHLRKSIGLIWLKILCYVMMHSKKYVRNSYVIVLRMQHNRVA